MKRCSGLTLLVVLFLSFAVFLPQVGAQVDHITIAAGTDQDHALQTITSEQDAQKRLAMYEEFVQKFSSDPASVAYGNWQLAQGYQAAGDMQKALDSGDKALAASPHNLDVLVTAAGIAQQAKNFVKLMDYSAKGGEVCAAVAKQPKPEGMSDADFASKVSDDKTAVQNSCDFLESSGLSAIASETDAKNRMAEIEKFSTAFPDSKYGEQVSNYAMYTLGPDQLNDKARLVAFGEKALAANPGSLAALLLLANYYGDETKPGSAAKAISYSQKAIEVAKPDAPDADKSHKIAGGVAHSTIGWAYLKQEKTVSAIPELKTASALLKGQDEQQYARALYGLGFAYAKLNKLTEAREVLNEVAKMQGPFQGMSQDLLTKVNSARAKGN